MSNTVPKKGLGKLLKPFGRLHIRSRTPSPAPPATPTSGTASRIDSTVGAAPIEPPATTTSKQISLDDVLELLEPKHQSILLQHQADPLDVGTTIQNAINAAVEKKKQCDERKWRLIIGNKTVILRDKADAVVGLVSKFKDIGSIAVGADPVHAGLPWAGICLLLQVFVVEKEQMEALMNGILVALSMHQTANLYLEIYNDEPAGPHAKELRRSLVRVYAAVLAFLAEALRLLDANGSTRFCNALLGDDGLRKFPLNCREHLEDVGAAARLCDRQLDKRTIQLVADTKNIVTGITDQLEDLRAEAFRTRMAIEFAKLPVVAGAQYDSSSATSACLQGTRVELLADITRWADDQTGECIFWLQGIAGEGKSTVAKTVAADLQQNSKLGASFFFKSDEIDRADATKFFTTIATQLAQRIGGMKTHLAEFLSNELSGYDKTIPRQFEDLIAAPLRKINYQLSRSRFIIVVDALDECRDTDLKQVVELLAQCELFGIRSLITSRPDAPVKKAFSGLKQTQYRQVILRDHTRDMIHHDIALFLEGQFQQLREGMFSLQNDWPGRDAIEALTQRSVPLFIFATTVCAFIAKDDLFGPDEQLEAVLAETSEDRLSQTYLPVLRRLLKDRTPKDTIAVIEEFRGLVGPIVISAEPMPVDFVVKLHGLKSREQLRPRLGRLHSVLHVGVDDNEEDQTIHPFHLSFQDFLVEPSEPHDFQIDERRAHASISNTCFSLMMEPGNLRQDICAVSKPGTRRRDIDPDVINKHIGPALAYACRFWLYHQVRSGESLDDSHHVYHFLTRHFLYWFEAMAWLGKAYEILPVLGRLIPLFDETCSTKLRELVEDVYHFVHDFTYIANQAPLQLYVSALAFAPDSSHVKSLFKNCMPRWLVIPPKVADAWGTNPLALEGHADPINGMSFSSCGEYLATCSNEDVTLRVWRSATGDCILEIPRSGHWTPIAVSFSRDNKYIAAAYLGRPYTQDIPLLAIIYDMETGNPIKTYVCFRAKVSKDHGIRMAFAPGRSDTLFVAIMTRHRLEMWRTKLESSTFEKAWVTRIRTKRGDIAISASDSLVSWFSSDSQSITCCQLESGAYVSSHCIELGNSYFQGFIDCRGRDLVYMISGKRHSRDDEMWLGMPIVQKLNLQTGQVDFVTYMKRSWHPKAISLKTGAIAYTKIGSGVVYMIALLQCPKVDDSTDPEERRVFCASVSHNGEAILLAYWDHVELRDVLGNLVFKSSKVHSVQHGRLSVSGDGSVVAVQLLDYRTHVWFVKSGRELHVPRMGDWRCSAAISSDGKLMAFSLQWLGKSSDGNGPYINVNSIDRYVGQILLWDLEKNQKVKVVNTGDFLSPPEAWMLFSEDDKTLHTDKGDLDVETGDWKTGSLYIPDESKRSMSDDNTWLQFNGEDMLWLPEAHRPLFRSRGYFGNNTIAYEYFDGSVVVMRCADPLE